jgi:phosphoribosylformylglycinamidine synthase
MARYQIYVTFKQVIFDPAGETAQRALQNMGFADVQSVRIGKYIELETTGVAENEHDQVTAMCDKLLANPVIEDYRIESEQQPSPGSDDE